MTAKVEGEKLIIFFDARIDTNNSAEIESEITNFVAENPNLILEFDAENLEYISSVGLRVLLKFRKKFNKNLVIKNVSKDVAEVFEMSGFTKFFDVQKKLRQISVENLQKIGQGSTGAVYKLDDENILKVYYEHWTLENVQFERQNSQQAFLSGLDTAIAYDVVKVGKSFGIVYEMLNADTLEKIILANPEQAEFYAKKFVEFVKKQHKIEFDGVSSKQERMKLSKQIKNISDRTHGIILEILETVPERKNFSHGDLNLSNIVIQDGNFLMIDMGEISCGHPIFDIAWIYFMYVFRQRVVKEHLEEIRRSGHIPGGPKFMPEIFWKTFSQEYFNTKDAQTLEHFERELLPQAIIQLLISSIARPWLSRAVEHYESVLNQIYDAGLLQIDF